MKRSGQLFEQVFSLANLFAAARKAQAGKRFRPDVLRFNLRLEDNLVDLQRELLNGTYIPQGHRHFQIREPKTRWISAAPYRDRVVHHALCQVIEPIIDRRLIFDCWANRRGKGSHRAVLRYQQYAGRFGFALKMDLQKYFPSIDHLLLKQQFRCLFKDDRLLGLMDSLVDHGQNPEPAADFFPGDDLFTPFERRRGLPIGNLTSQLWANLFLDRFDHWVKEQLRATGYLRFVDDFVLLADSSGQLLEWKAAVTAALAQWRLRVHPRKCVVRRTSEGLPFLGYLIWPDRIRVRGETVRRFRRRMRKKGVRGAAGDLESSLAAWRGHVMWAGTFRRLGGVE